MQQKSRGKYAFLWAAAGMGAAALTGVAAAQLATQHQVWAQAIAHVSALPADQQKQKQERRDLAAAQACPAGHAVQWLDATTMTCLREVAP